MKLSNREQTRLRNKYGSWALITGASSGIGKELAMNIAACGINTILVARNESKLSSLKSEIENEFSVEALVVPVDLGTNAVHKIIEAAEEKDVGLLVASAGFGTSGDFIRNSIHQEMNMLEVNCKALLELTHYYANRFVQQKKGGIILLSSMVAFQGAPYSANYAATKAYVQSLAEGLYHELKPHKVDVLAAAPGPVKSGFGNRANMKMDMSLNPEQVAVPILKALGRKMTVLPGFLTKFLVYSLRTTPRWGKIRIMKMVMGGMTKHQRVD